MNSNDNEIPARPLAAAPKRVPGGLVLKAKKKKRRNPDPNGSASLPAAGGQPLVADPSPLVPRILSSLPPGRKETPRVDPPEARDEFGDDTVDADVPSDALLCLQSYTRPLAGGMAETCAYCPIVTREGRSHAAPFLLRPVLRRLLTGGVSSSSEDVMRSSEQHIQRLASSNKIRLLQLHGTARSGSHGGSFSWRGGGDDEEDVAVMETSAYLVAAEMALRNDRPDDAATCRRVYSFLETLLLPRFVGKSWFSNGALGVFYDDIASERKAAAMDGAPRQHPAIPQMKEATQHLVCAGILLPRSGTGPRRGLEGYWFSLPGLGRAAKSIVEGRTALLRRLHSSRYKEKKRSVLEHEIGRIRQRDAAKDNGTELPGKIVILDLLAKGWVEIHKTCTGEQFVRLKG